MNRKKKIRFWNGIRFKLTFGLLILVTLSGFLLYFLVTEILNRNIESQITSDLLKLQSNTEVYVRQLLMLKGQNNDEESFGKCAYEIAEELFNTSQNQLVLFTKEGEPLLDYGYKNQENREDLYGNICSKESFRTAVNGRAAYILLAGPEGQYDVWFTMPLNVAGKNIGIVNYYLDYTNLYQQYTQIARMVLEITLLIMLLISGIILLSLTGITGPIQKLSKISSRVTAEIKNNKVSTRKLIGKSLTGRKDELGQLSRDYSLMLNTMENQFVKIQEDRNSILQLLNSKQEFYNNVTHELKPPLTTIKGYAQLLEADGLTDLDLFHTALTHIQHESTRLHQMVIQLLEMSDKELHTPLVPIDLTVILNSVAAAMMPKARRYNNRILTECDTSVRILGHEERIRQLFINLIDNAIKYGMPEESIRACACLKGSHAVIQVMNKGEGITPEAMEHIFDPFYRIDKEHSRELGSAGLGLSICQKIMEEHNGSIKAESIPGKITIFTATFPSYKEDTEDENNS